MEGMGYYTGILTSNADHIPSLDDLTFTTTPHTHESTNDVHAEIQDDVLEVQETKVAGRRHAGKGASHRSKKFDKEEDKTICSAWLNVSKDPIHGANQTRGSFWGRICAYFDEHKETKAIRSENSIMHRWLTIQNEVNKFCSVYEKIERRNASGATIQDMIDQALQTYTGVDEENKSFTLIHCWNRLKDEDKWKSRRIELAEQQKPTATKKQKTTKESTPSNLLDNNNDEVEVVADPGSQERKKPKGQKQVKHDRWGGSDACIAALDKMWEKKEARDRERDKAREASLDVEKAALEVEKAALELEKKRLSNEEKKIEADLLKEEKDIMFADKSSLDADQLQWLEIMKKKILARHMEN